VQLKTYEWLISVIFLLIFSDHGWLWVTEAMKIKPCIRTIIYLQKGVVTVLSMLWTCFWLLPQYGMCCIWTECWDKLLDGSKHQVSRWCIWLSSSWWTSPGHAWSLCRACAHSTEAPSKGKVGNLALQTDLGRVDYWRIQPFCSNWVSSIESEKGF
jgi:hypothetical protein